LFIDEAHSIGALGPSGRGVCDHWAIHPGHVDILMGTFTKSFGAAGGYIASSKQLIEHFKARGHGYIYCEPIAPPICQQVLSALILIGGSKLLGGTQQSVSSTTSSAEVTVDPPGLSRIRSIQENSHYFMRGLKELGFIVYGDDGSPIVPMLIFNPAKIAAFSREALAMGMAVVVVGYPATPIITSRVRFCISAAHTRAQLDSVLERVSKIGDRLWMKVSKRKIRE
jgi:7-keto-8-aminopelargonate synthetase-like enzyme